MSSVTTRTIDGQRAARSCPVAAGDVDGGRAPGPDGGEPQVPERQRGQLGGVVAGATSAAGSLQ